MSSFQTSIGTRSSTMIETSCGYLLQELQMIWNEVGEDKFEREKVLLDLEQECVGVYRKKVDAANTSRARLHQELAEAEAEFTHLLLSLGERSLPARPEKMAGTLKEQLDSIAPALKEMRVKKEERMNEFRSVQAQIQKISAEIAGHLESSDTPLNLRVNENDLSLKKLEEYQLELQRLHNEKNERLERVEEYIDVVHKLSTILGLDSTTIIAQVHPSLNDLCGISKNISNAILAKLSSTVESLDEEKKKRLEKLHQLGKALTNMWNLMDTPYEERRLFAHVIRLLSLSSSEVSDPGSLTQIILVQAEAEVKRLDQLKASRMKELYLKKQQELEEICSKSHMEIPSRAEMETIFSRIRSGEIDHADLLVNMDEQISKAKEEALSRRAIIDKAEKWMLACDEEHWLEDYSRDDNRYSVSRGAHKNLRRAERARIAVNKIPALVDSLILRTKCWEEERKKVFLYDEVPLLAMLEEYTVCMREKELEKHRQREKKKVQNFAVVQQETPFGSRPGTSSFSSPVPLNRRLSLGIEQFGSNGINSTAQEISYMKDVKKRQGHKTLLRPRFSSSFGDETASVVSTFSGPISP